MAYTITHDESNAGWTSFHSFIPDWMQRLNNRFFTIKSGQLYLHNDQDNPIRNNFYGEQFPMEVKFISNDFPHDIKFAKTIKIEGNKAFDVEIRSYIGDETTSVTESTVFFKEFVEKEGLQYAHFRRNEISKDLSAKNAYGLGRVASGAFGEITLENEVPTGSISVGDSLYDEDNNFLGTVSGYSGNLITRFGFFSPAVGAFVYGKKNTRIEGSEIRGYNFEVDLTDSTTGRTELFAVNLGIAKSFPS